MSQNASEVSDVLGNDAQTTETHEAIQESLPVGSSFSNPSPSLRKILDVVGDADKARLRAEPMSKKDGCFEAHFYTLQDWRPFKLDHKLNNGVKTVADIETGILLIQDIDLSTVEILIEQSSIEPEFFARSLLRRAQQPAEPGGQRSREELTPEGDRVEANSLDGRSLARCWDLACLLDDEAGYRPSSTADEHVTDELRNGTAASGRKQPRHVDDRVCSVFGYKLKENLSLVLVDAPIVVYPRKSHRNTTLILLDPALSSSIVLPVFLSMESISLVPHNANTTSRERPNEIRVSMFDHFGECMRFWKYRDVLCSLDCTKPGSRAGLGVGYLLATAAWNYNLQLLENAIRELACSDIARPRVVDFDKWHLYRRSVSHANAVIEETLDMDPSPIIHTLRSPYRVSSSGDSVTKWTPYRTLRRLQNYANELSTDLKDLFDVLIGANAVHHSDRSHQLAQNSALQSKQTTTLTWLAAFYLPVTAVTGIFGMNIKEINGGTPKWWACLVVFAILLFVSIQVVTFVFSWQIGQILAMFEKKPIKDEEKHEPS